MENQNQGTQNPQQVNQQFNQQFGVPPLPNSTAVLVLGITSIVCCFCYGIVGLILGIIALVLAGKANTLYQQYPGNYSESSYKNLKAGKICAIIGACLSGVYFVILALYIAFIGSLLSAMPWGEIFKH